MRFQPRHPKEIIEEMELLKKSHDDSLTPFSKKTVLLAAVLRKMGFRVIFAHDGSQKGFGEGPRLDLESPDGRKLRNTKWPPDLSPEREARMNEISRLNIVYQAKLLELLEAFYMNQQPASFKSRLTLRATALEGSELAPQAVSIMKMPEYKSQRKKWLKESLAEMNAFAEFLITKLPKNE